MADPTMRIYLIRHGETAANRDGILQGHKDFPLLEEGIQMAAAVGCAFSEVQFDAAFSSPLTRAMQTTRAVLEASGNANTPVQTDSRLMEIDMGIASGMPIRGTNASSAASSEEGRRLGKLFFEGSDDFPGFPGGETFAQVKERTQNFLRELASQNYTTVLVSTHGCALRAMLNCLTGNPADFWQGHVPPNCAVCIVEASGPASSRRLELAASDLILYQE